MTGYEISEEFTNRLALYDFMLPFADNMKYYGKDSLTWLNHRQFTMDTETIRLTDFDIATIDGLAGNMYDAIKDLILRENERNKFNIALYFQPLESVRGHDCYLMRQGGVKTRTIIAYDIERDSIVIRFETLTVILEAGKYENDQEKTHIS